ncbi:hypothetical protein [uncultured Sphingomonas sp.]|uniref:hypothetical protein n=1 Tax=uncultured Sphingomonas sp. TaxID=158754 RepID=UPI0035CC254D
MTGCYSSEAPSQPQRLLVERSGSLVIGTETVPVSGYHDKDGDALLPTKKIVVVQVHLPTIEVDTGYPLLLRAIADRRGLFVPSEADAGMSFDRVPCSAATRDRHAGLVPASTAGWASRSSPESFARTVGGPRHEAGVTVRSA